MNFFKCLIVFVVIYTISSVVIRLINKKYNIESRLVVKFTKYKKFNLIIGVIVIISFFLIEYSKQLLNERLGKDNNTFIYFKR